MATSIPSKPFFGGSNFSTKLLTHPNTLTFRRSNLSFEVKAAGSTYGNYFRVTTYGESHGGGVGCVVDGCPPRLPLTEEDLQLDLDRRRPGQSRITTPRKETDTCKIISGISDGFCFGLLHS